MNELIAYAVAILVALGGAWVMGRKSEENKQVKKRLDSMKEAKVNYEEVQRLGDGDISNEFDRLREKRR